MARKRLNVRFLVVLVTIASLVLVALAVGGWWYKESPGRAIRRAQEAEERGDWQKAADQWAKAGRASNNAEYMLKAIDATLKRTSEPNGLELLQQVYQNYTALLASDPTLLPALRGQMRLLARDRSFAGPRATGATREVRRLAGEILKQEPGDSEAKTLRALATINLAQFTGENVTPEDVEQAELELRSVVETNPGDGLAVSNLAQRLLARAETTRTADPDAALEQWQQTVQMLDDVAERHGALPETPTLDQARLHWRLGQAYGLAARLKPMLDAVKLVSAGTPASELDGNKLAADPVVKGTSQKAHDHMAKARQALDEQRDVLEEDFREIRTAYADSLRAQGMQQEAEQELRDILELRPWDTQASAMVARVLHQQNRLEEAVTVVREARQRESDPLPELSGHAGVNARLNRMLLKPYLAEVLLTRYDSTRDEEQRQALLSEAGEIYEQYEGQRKAMGYPALSESTRIAGQLQMAEGDVAGGIQTLTSALRLTAQAASQQERQERLKVLGLLVEANRKLGQTGAQQRYLEEMVQVAPGVPQFQRELAQVYLAQGQRERALQIIQGLQKQFPNDGSLQQLALQATPPEQRQVVYSKLPENSTADRQAKLGAALRLGSSDEILRLGTALLDELPATAEGRTAEQQQQFEGLTLTVAQQLDRAGRTEEAVAMVQPLAETSATAKALLTQLQGGTEALIGSLPEGVNKLLIEAQLAELRGDLETSLAKLEEASRLAPDNDAVGNRLFNAYLVRERLDAARQLAEKLRARGADEMNGATYAVRLALAGGETDAAVEAATRLAQTYPQFAEALALHGEALRRAGRHAEAADAYRRALDLAPNTPAALAGILSSLEEAGRFQEARPYIDAGLRLQPNSPVFRDADRVFQIRFGDPTEVIAARRRAVTNDLENVAARYELGQTLLFAAAAASRVGDQPRAQEHLREAVQVFAEAAGKFPRDVRLLQGLMQAASQVGAEALATAEPVIQAAVIAPDAPLSKDVTAVAVAADFLRQQGNLARAESVVRSAMSETSLTREQRVALLLMLSELLIEQNRLEDAIAVLAGYEDVPAVLQRKVEVLARRVSAQPQDAGLYQAMRQASDVAVQERMIPVGALPPLAYAEMQRGDLGRAAALLDQALSRQANNPRALLLRGAVEARREGGDLDRAAQLLEQAREIVPDDPDTLRELARTQRRRGLQEEAIAALTRLTEVQPANAEPRLELLNLLLSLNPPRFADASRQFRAAERAGIAGDARLLMARAQMERLRGQLQEALPFARQAVESVQRDPAVPQAARDELLNIFLSLLLEAKEYDDVLERTQPLLAAAEGASWQVLQIRGQALAGLGRRDEAIAAYRESVTKAAAVAQDDAVLVEMSRQLGFEPTYALIKDRVEPSDGSQPRPRDLIVASAVFAGAGQIDRAIALLEQAMKGRSDLTPQQQAALDTQLGTLFLLVSPRRLDRAVEHLRGAYQMQSEDAGVMNNLAYALTLQGDAAQGEAAAAKLTEAVEIARRAYDLHLSASRRMNREPSPTILDTYGWALGLSSIATSDTAGQDEALRLLREARGIAESSDQQLPEIYLHLSRLLAARGAGREAQDAAEAGLAVLDRRRSGPDPLEPHMEADLRAALVQARDQASAVDERAAGGS